MAGRDVNPPVPRTVRLTEPEHDERFGREDLSLADFRSDHSYVLLGEPGLGKSTAFETEAHRVRAPDPIPARRFISRDFESRLDGQAEPLFIDGLDEVRAGSTDPRSPLDKILARLDTLGTPPFRLSCRSGSWLGAGDLRELSSLPGGAPLRVLQLNPLCREGVRQIVCRRRDDADEFITKAFEHGMDTFLWNPQLLAVLLDSVGAAGWPESPTEAFGIACRELSKEWNIDHRDAGRRIARPSRDAVLSAAGQLSALMLIAGKGGWTATDTDDPDLLSLHEVEAGNRATLLAALESAVFSGPASFRTPAHRLLAEFLGGRYLDERIRALEGVTVRRTLSLVLAHDGIPLPDLRGLSAWLAAFNPDARRTLIRADPTGVAFDGDASGFTSEERRELFERLEKSPDLGRRWPSTASLGALAGSRDRVALRELVSSPERSSARQNLVLLLLSGLASTGRPGDIALGQGSDADHRELENIVRDPTWRGDIRRRALSALARLLRGNPARQPLLRSLLAELKEGRLPDDGNRLLGTLLDNLYPGDLPPGETWDYLAVVPFTHRFDAYQRFWLGLVDRSSAAEIRELLDSLCVRAAEVIPKLAAHGLAGVVMELLARGLELFGDDMSVDDLYHWFELVEADLQRPGLVPAHCRNIVMRGLDGDEGDRIHAWLEARDDTRFSLIVRGLAERESEIGERFLDGSVGDKFLGRNPPEGFRQRCLGKATEMAPAQCRVARELASWAIRDRPDWGPPLTDEEVARAVEGTPSLENWNDDRLEARESRKSEEAAWKKRHAAFEDRVRERQRAYGASVREHAAELAEGNGPPALLHDLAQRYLEALAEEDSEGAAITRLRLQIGDDPELADAALSGFRSLLDRDDLPDLDQTLHLHETNQMSFFALPFLAGLAEEERLGTHPLHRLDAKQLRRALGYYFVSHMPGKYSALLAEPSTDTRPAWYLEALASRPEAVAGVLVAVHQARVRMKAGPDRHLHEMSQDPAYEYVTPLAVKRMFTAFPSRCTGSQVETLRLVIWAALDPRNMAPPELARLVRRRLERRGMDVAQRVQWLCAGLFVARSECLPQLRAYLADGSVQRAYHVVDFFMSFDHQLRGALSLDDWEAAELAVLLQAVGGRLRRYEPPEGVGMLGDEQLARFRAEPLLRRLIDALAERADDEAAVALESLATDPALGGWSGELTQARETQAERLRAARHETPGLASIQETLKGGRPGSAADLAALALEKLEGLGEHIRDGETNDWRQYWHRDPKSGQPSRPQHENDCRDALLSDLKRLLRPHDVDARKEGQYADDKRADLRVAYGSRLAVPVEIKKNSHRDVWRAVDQQLVARYTRAPESEGYGIYLVLWFGTDHMKVVPPSGNLPRTPTELAERLEERLTPEQRARIGVVVIDVSPSGKYAAEDS